MRERLGIVILDRFIINNPLIFHHQTHNHITLHHHAHKQTKVDLLKTLLISQPLYILGGGQYI